LKGGGFVENNQTPQAATIKFTNKEAIKYGWETMKANFWFFCLVLVVTFAISGVFSFLANHFKNDLLLNIVIQIISFIVSLFISVGLTKILLNIYDKKEVKLADLFSGAPQYVNYLVGSIIYSLIVMVGFILFFFPGIYLALKYQFYCYLIVEKNMGPWEAIKASGKITDGYKWKLFGFIMLSLLINLAGLIALIIGMFATIPLIMMAQVYIYKKLSAGIVA